MRESVNFINLTYSNRETPNQTVTRPLDPLEDAEEARFVQPGEETTLGGIRSSPLEPIGRSLRIQTGFLKWYMTGEWEATGVS